MRTSLPKLAAASALSAASFAVADAYAACLLSLPGQPAANLAAVLAALPAWLASGHALSAEAGPVAAGVVAACGVWIAWAYSLIREGNFRSGEEHGSARWGKRLSVLGHAGARLRVRIQSTRRMRWTFSKRRSRKPKWTGSGAKSSSPRPSHIQREKLGRHAAPPSP